MADNKARWASRFSEVRPTKLRERTDAQQAALDKATADALGGLPMTGSAIEDEILGAASEQLKPLRVRQRHEAMRREAVHSEAQAKAVAPPAEEDDDESFEEWKAQFEYDNPDEDLPFGATEEVDESSYLVGLDDSFDEEGTE